MRESGVKRKGERKPPKRQEREAESASRERAERASETTKTTTESAGDVAHGVTVNKRRRGRTTSSQNKAQLQAKRVTAQIATTAKLRSEESRKRSVQKGSGGEALRLSHTNNGGRNATAIRK